MLRFVPRRRVTLSGSMVPAAAAHLLGPGSRRSSVLRELELALSAWFHGMSAIAVDSGRNALMCILRALGLEPGSRVIIPDYTLDSLAVMIRDEGLEPVPVDVCEGDYNLDPNLLEDSARSKKARVVVALHIFGVPFRIAEVKQVCERHRMFLIEDCAHALGSTLDGSRLGTFGDAAILSFSSIKAVHGLGGGAALFKDRELAARASAMLQGDVTGTDVLKIASATLVEEIAFNPWLFGLAAGPLLHEPVLGEGIRKIYRMTKSAGTHESPAPRRMSGLQAALCLAGLGKLESEKSRRKEIARIYRQGLDDVLHLQQVGQGADPFPFAQVVRLDSQASRVARSLYRKGIDVGHGPQIMQSCSAALGGEPLPVTQVLLDRCIELPMSARMRAVHAGKVVDALRSGLGR